MPDVEVVAFGRSHVAQAAKLVRGEIERLRATVPALPDAMTRMENVAERLDRLVVDPTGLAAVRDGRLVGFLGWATIDDFRGTGRRAAHCPEWAHATTTRDRERIYHVLYRAASRQWTVAGCRAHAISLLAHQADAVRAWCWNGFGVAVIDAIRSTGDPDRATVTGAIIRRAEPADLDVLVALESEHWRHYALPPMLMAAQGPSQDEIRDVLEHPKASYWLAIDANQPIGFLRFEPTTEGASGLVRSTGTIAISGAFVRPDRRGRGVATALLNAALRAYSDQGYDRCSVDFESFNPEAAGFWLRFFTPACISMVRYPELDRAPASLSTGR